MLRLRLAVVAIAFGFGCGSVSSDPKPDAAIDAPEGTGALTLAEATKWVPQSGTATVAFTIARDAALTGTLTVRVGGLPTGVTASDVTVAPGASAGVITFSATTASTVGATTNVTVELVSDGDMIDSDAFGVFVAGAPGTLDTTFGNAGRVTFPLPDPVVAATSGNGYARAVAQYPANAAAHAGKLVIVAELDTTGTPTQTRKMAVARFNPDGTPDLQFGTNGYVIIQATTSNGFSPVDVDLDSQGRIVVTGRYVDTSNVCYIYVSRVLASGSGLDSSFTPFVQNPPGGYCGGVSAAVILAGDKVLTAANWNNPDGSERLHLGMVNADGTPDNTAFSGSWSLRVPNPSSSKHTLHATDLDVDASGRYLVSGNKCDGGYSVTKSACESIVGRLTAAGAWDTTFGAAGAGNNLGYSALTFGTTDGTPQPQYFWSLAADASNNIFTVGFSEEYTLGTLAKFTSTGALDSNFGTSGRVSATLVANATLQDLTELSIDSQGRIVAAGYANSGGSLVVVTRYSAGGQLDTTFGTNGVSTVPASALDPHMTLQPDGRIVVTGSFPRTGGGHDVAMWRFWP